MWTRSSSWLRRKRHRDDESDPVRSRARVRSRGQLAAGRARPDAISREAELEEVTDALLLTRSDDLNTLGAAELRDELGHRHVYRVAPHPDDPDLLPPSREAGILGNRSQIVALDIILYGRVKVCREAHTD